MIQLQKFLEVMNQTLLLNKVGFGSTSMYRILIMITYTIPRVISQKQKTTRLAFPMPDCESAARP